MPPSSKVIDSFNIQGCKCKVTEKKFNSIFVNVKSQDDDIIVLAHLTGIDRYRTYFLKLVKQESSFKKRSKILKKMPFSMKTLAHKPQNFSIRLKKTLRRQTAKDSKLKQPSTATQVKQQ